MHHASEREPQHALPLPAALDRKRLGGWSKATVKGGMGSDSATKAAPALRLIERNRPSATCKGTAAWSLPDVSARGRTGSDSNVVGVHDKFSVGGLDMGTIIISTGAS